MFKIVSKRYLNPTVTMMDIEAPLVARKAQAGQFIIVRTDEDGERIPLTVAGCDREKGTVKIIFQKESTEGFSEENGKKMHDASEKLENFALTEGAKRKQ